MKLKIYSFDGQQIIIECKYFKMDDVISGYLNYVDLNDNRMTIYNVSKVETVVEIYRCIKTFEVLTFSQQHGSIKEGTNWELVREPIPTKKCIN